MSSAGTLVLLTTSRGGTRIGELKRLRDSIMRFVASSPDTIVRHYILLQNFEVGDGDEDPIPGSADCRVYYSPELLSLSRARNVLLGEVRRLESLDKAVVCFPDDDAWYPDSALLNIMQSFSDDPLVDLWVCRSGPSPQWPRLPVQQRLRLQPLISNGTSNTIFMRGSLVQMLGGFDEELGLGTAAKSGEDTDYGLRAFQMARSTAFLDAVAVGHRAFDQRDRVLYFSGALFAIARHASHVPGGYLALLRKCVIGGIWFVLGQMKLGELTSSLWKVLRILRGQRL